MIRTESTTASSRTAPRRSGRVEGETELCFDDKFERAPRAEAQVCRCGATDCRGFIGAKPADDGDDDEVTIPNGRDYGTDEEEEREAV